MIAGLKNGKTPAVALFVAVNMAVIAFAIVVLFAPILSHFSGRSEEISENASQLARFENIMRQARTSAQGAAGRDNVFLAGNEERVVSADLQAALKSLATAAGVNLLGIRGLTGARSQQLRMIGVGVELEGTLAAIRDMMRAIESQTPLLFVSSISLRSITDGDDGPIRAEMTVQGAMRVAQKPGGEKAISQ